MKSFSSLWESYYLILGAASSVLGYIGDKLGLYKAMYDFGKPHWHWLEGTTLTGDSTR
jgi:hypothetical protein